MTNGYPFFLSKRGADESFLREVLHSKTSSIKKRLKTTRAIEHGQRSVLRQHGLRNVIGGRLAVGVLGPRAFEEEEGACWMLGTFMRKISCVICHGPSRLSLVILLLALGL